MSLWIGLSVLLKSDSPGFLYMMTALLTWPSSPTKTFSTFPNL